MYNFQEKFKMETSCVLECLKHYLNLCQKGIKTTIVAVANKFHVKRKTLSNALHTFYRNGKVFSQGKGAPPIFSEQEEILLANYLHTKAQCCEALTQNEFLDFASELYRRICPEAKKLLVENHRHCSASSGKTVEIEYGRLSYHWLQGFKNRAFKRSGVEYNMMHPDYLDVNRGEVTLEELESNHKDFVKLCARLQLDVNSQDDRRFVAYVDESGISGSKSASRQSRETVMMPSTVNARPTRKRLPNRGHITALIGGTMDGVVLPTLFIDKSSAKELQDDLKDAAVDNTHGDIYTRLEKAEKGDYKLPVDKDIVETFDMDLPEGPVDEIEVRPVYMEALSFDEAGGLSNAYKVFSKTAFMTRRIFLTYIE